MLQLTMGYMYPFKSWFSLDMLRSGISGLYGTSMFVFFLRNLHNVLREKAMVPHSSTVARKIPWMEEPGRLQSMGSLRVRHDWVTSLSLSNFMHWRRKWQPTPVFLPGEYHGQKSLVGCSPWGRTESDTTEAIWQHNVLHWYLYQFIFPPTV